MRAPLKIGLVGCGAMGQGHLQVWKQIPAARVVAVCDGDRKRAEETAAQLGAQPFTSLEAMLTGGGVEAVDLCTPSGLHADQGLTAALHGAHVLCEKPLDLNLEKADRLIAACEQRGLALACLLQNRAFPAGRQVARYIAEGRLGRLISCSASVKWWRSQEYYDSSGWRGSWALDGGVMANQAIHTLDMLCWLVGAVETVEYAHLETASHCMEAEDNALAILKFACGARGVFEATTCSYPDLCARIEIVGTQGAVAFENANVTRFGFDGEDKMFLLEHVATNAGSGGATPMAITLDGHQRLMEDFALAIQEGRPPLVSGKDARVSLDALTQIYRKALPEIRLGV